MHEPPNAPCENPSMPENSVGVETGALTNTLAVHDVPKISRTGEREQSCRAGRLIWVGCAHSNLG